MSAIAAQAGCAPSWSPDIDRRRLAEKRTKACEAFMATRGTSFARLAAVVGKQIEGIEYLLMTSSPVHGLANATSDIDTICIVEGDALAERTAAQIFDEGNHYETIPFTRGELSAELNRLADAAALPPSAALSTYRRWDKGGPISRKYLERIVNGVAADGTSPFLGSLADLATLWRAAAMSRAVVMVECARLSLFAGEARGALGYGFNALLYGMDALLSHHGTVYSNKKWYLLRLHRFLDDEDGPADGKAAAHMLLQAWAETQGALLAPQMLPDLLNGLASRIGMLEDMMDLPLSRDAHWTMAADASGFDFLPRARLQLSGDQFVVTPAAPGAAPFLGQSGGCDPAVARTRLHAARAGILKPAFEPGEAS